MLTERVAGNNGTTKMSRGGMSSVISVLHVILIYDISLPDDRLNVFRILDDHMTVRKELFVNSNRLLLGARAQHMNGDVATFSTNQHIGRNTFTKIVPSVYSKMGITGDGPHETVTLNGLHATMITFLQEA